MFNNLSSWWNKAEDKDPPIEEGEEKEPETDGNASWNKIASNLFQSVSGYATVISENVKKQVKETTSTSLIGEFQKEQDKFAREQQRFKDASVPPWVGYNEEEQLKAQILEISSDSRNVLREPPPEVEFPFDYPRAAPVAMVMLKEDARLQKLRFDLVPKKVSEETFWRNYFYRVSLIKQSVQISTLSSAGSQTVIEEREGQPLAADDEKDADNTTTKEEEQIKVETNADETVDEFISDHPYNAEAEHVTKETLKRELSQLGVAEGEEGSAVNENELWDELQAELKELDLQDDQVDEGLLLVDWDQEIKSFMTEENTT